jgi:hypothetical protein
MMPYSDITTRSAGYKVLASDFNDLVNGVNRANSGTASVGRSAVMATSTSTTSLATGTWTLMTFASEEYDTQSSHSTSSNTGRLTANETGLYQVHGMVTMDYHTSKNMAGLQLRKNAAGSSTGGTLIAQSTTMISDNSLIITAATINTMIRLTSSDYVELFVVQNSGGSLALKGTTLNHRFGAIWLTS